MSKSHATVLLGWTFLCCCLAAAPSAPGDEKPASSWPCWRGPNGDGFSADVPQAMPEAKLLWKMPLAGKCDAGVSVAEGCVVVADNDAKNDYYRCFEAGTGKALWVAAVPNGRKMDYGPAPRSTPCIYKGKVFTVGAFGDVHGYDLKTGKELWRKDFKADFKAGETPTWGYCTAPVVVDGKLILFPRSVFAVEPDTGALVWEGQAAGANYSNFLVATFGGITQLIGYDAANCRSWDPGTGKQLWKLEIDSSKGYIVPSPVRLGSKLLLSSDDEDTRLYDFDKAGKPLAAPEAESRDLAPEMATPTVTGDMVLGLCEGLVCLDAQNKLKTLWIEEKEDAFYGMGSIIASKDRVLVFDGKGTMVLVAPEKAKCGILGKIKLCGDTWSHPALAGGRVYIRDEKTVYCYQLVPKAAAGPAK